MAETTRAEQDEFQTELDGRGEGDSDLEGERAVYPELERGEEGTKRLEDRDPQQRPPK